MGDRQLQPLARVGDDAALEPAGLPRRVGGDDELVGGEDPQGVFDREAGIGVADFPAGLQAQAFETEYGDDVVEADVAAAKEAPP